jgi:4-amino-4-deoxychorismate lyase
MIDPVTAAASAQAHGDRLRVLDPDRPAIKVLDLGLTRGDGIFETFGVIGKAVQAVQPHLRRLQRSARLLDLPELDLEVIEAAVRLSVEKHELDDLLVKLVVTRGIERVERPTAFAYAFEEDYSARQRNGIRVVCLDRGYSRDVAQSAPWLLQGAKTLSYAVNKAALREAARRGAEDVIFTSSDGYVLEGPTSTVIVRKGEEFITPRTDQGILEGTTQAALFGIVETLGYRADYRYMRREELDHVDGLWLVSSGQQIAPVIALDGREIEQDRELTESMLKQLRARTT